MIKPKGTWLIRSTLAYAAGTLSPSTSTKVAEGSYIRPRKIPVRTRMAKLHKAISPRKKEEWTGKALWNSFFFKPLSPSRSSHQPLSSSNSALLRAPPPAPRTPLRPGARLHRRCSGGAEAEAAAQVRLQPMLPSVHRRSPHGKGSG